MLEIRNLRKAFGDLQVLKGIDLDVNKGDVVAILGASGSGKTTMLRCLNFLEKADDGTMTFDGQRVELAHVTRAQVNALRRRTGFVFQNYNLFANKTALQNVTEGLIVARKMPRRQADEIARAALVRVGMADRADYYPNQLSGGQQQRVGIATALITSPRFIIADEPTTALDSITQRQIVDLLTSLVDDAGASMLFITHDFAVLARATTRCYVLDGGSIAETGTTASLLREPASEPAQRLVAAARQLTLSRDGGIGDGDVGSRESTGVESGDRTIVRKDGGDE